MFKIRNPYFGSPVALAMIVRNNAKGLKKCLASAEPYVNEIVIVDTGSTDGGATVGVAKDYGALVIERPDLYDEKLRSIRSFAEARNISFDATHMDYILWLDSDDELVNGEHLHAAIRGIHETHAPGMWLRYNYARNRDGQWIIVHYKRRLLERNCWRWEGNVHEDPMPLNGTECVYVPNCPITIDHDLVVEDMQDNESAARNMRILLRDWETMPNAEHSRVPGDLARAYAAAGDAKKALEFYAIYEKHTCGDSESFRLYFDRADCYMHMDPIQVDLAEGEFWKAIKVWPDDPRPWIGLARCKAHKQAWSKVIEYADHAATLRVKPSPVPFSPIDLQFGLFSIRQQALVALGQHGQAMEEAIAMKEEHGLSMGLRTLLDCYQWEAKTKKANNALLNVLRILPEPVADTVINALPDDAKGMESPIRYKAQIDDNRENELVIFVGSGPEWGPTINEEEGTGGSESMVVQMAPRFAERGFRVKVYGGVSKPIITPTVAWYPAEWFMDRREYGNLLIWRNNAFLNEVWMAERTFIWHEDAIRNNDITHLQIDRAHQWWFVSNWAREQVSRLGDEKCWVTRNGIDVPSHRAAAAKHPEKTPKLVIHSSSPDRGLWVLLRAWDYVTREVPEARLVVFYGFRPHWMRFEENHRMPLPGGPACNYGELRVAMTERMAKDPTIDFRGMVPEPELLEWFARAQVWAYPTLFGETSCITAMHAQAMGAWPVYTPFGALKETCFSGTPVEPSNTVWTPAMVEEYANELVKVLQDPTTQQGLPTEVREEALRRFDLDTLADEWADRIRSAPRDLPLERRTSEFWDPEFREKYYPELMSDIYPPVSEEMARFVFMANATKETDSCLLVGGSYDTKQINSKHVTVVTLAKDSVAAAKRMADESRNGTTYDVKWGTIEEYLQNPPATKFDIIVAGETLEHLTDHDWLMRQFKKIGRRLAISIPDFFGYAGMPGQGQGTRDGHIILYTPRQFGNFISKYGAIEKFSVEEGHILALVNLET